MIRPFAVVISAARQVRMPLGFALLLQVSGCGGMQSVLDPQSIEAREIAFLWWLMFWGAAAILALVLALALYALVARPQRRHGIYERVLVLGGGLALPLVVLTALLVYSVFVGNAITRPESGTDALHIDVVGHQWWWAVRYRNAEGEMDFATANELHVPVGRRVEVTVSTADVIHSFWIPALAGKIDMIPGRRNRVRFTADQAGVYRGQCAEFCGAHHAVMAFHVIVESPEAFAAWQAQQREPAATPDDPLPARGREAFMEQGCLACHTIRGTAAAGRTGPDLTHVGSRRALAAGALPNDADALVRWIAHNQEIKPGNAMPSFAHLDDATLRALAAYLESLQ